MVWVFLPSLNREEDSETCLHWASVDWHNICSALNQNETFITGRSSVTPLHGNIFFWSEKYIYTPSENNSQLNSPTWRPTSDISQKIEYKVTIVLFFTLNTKQVQAWIDDYFIQICPNTGFIPALIYQALGFLLSCSFNFFLLSFFFFFSFSKARVPMNNWTVLRSKCHSRENCLRWLVIRISLFVM